MRAPNLHGALRRRGIGTVGTTHGKAGLYRPLPRVWRLAVDQRQASPWSNGQTEGQITRLKLVRRQMYGRGKIDLLQTRLIGAD